MYQCGCEDVPEDECDCNSILGTDTNEDGDPDDFASHYMDECGVCGGSGITDGACDCFGNVLDECGVCGGTGIPDEECDCNSICLDGSECTDNQCVDGSDCNSHIEDDCDVCGGDNSSCTDCAGILNGDNVYDECGLECIVNPFADCSVYCDAYSENDCVQDCSGAWGGSAVEDECGVCGGECDYSNNDILCNGNWDGDGPTCPTADCEGVPGGEILVDECFVCGRYR